MSAFTAIDLSQLPAPDVIEALDYEAILAALKADLIARDPDLADALALESEPLTKLLEVCAYRETILRARINAAARAVLLPYATGADLDNLGAWWGVARRDTDTDATFRTRIQLSLEAHTSAGSIGAYTWHALEADPSIADVGVSSPIPGTVRLVVLSTAADGQPTPEALAAVLAACSAEDVRPLCDTVTAEAAAPLPFTVRAHIRLGRGPNADTVAAAIDTALAAYLASARRVGGAVYRSGLFSALHAPGVLSVELAEPPADVIAGARSFPSAGTIELTLDGSDLPYPAGAAGIGTGAIESPPPIIEVA